MQAQSGLEMRNWEGSVVWHPAVIAYPESVDDIITIMKNPQQYPAPLRAVGSNHSTTLVNVADGGTMVVMTKMNRILNIGRDTVTTEAGVLLIDVAEKLHEHGLQLYVNIELGNLTMGSAACCGTKDASMPGEFGQVCSYVSVIKLVTPAGELITIDESQPELLQAARSSYGLFGIVYEVTFKIRNLKPLKTYHETYNLDEFIRRLPELKARNESMMFYLAVFLDSLTVEYRVYQETNAMAMRWFWWLRNNIWILVGPGLSAILSRYFPFPKIRYFLIDNFYRIVQILLDAIGRGAATIAEDQIIRYPEKGGWNKYTFSLWAFPEEDYPRIIRAYYDFCHKFYRDTGYRTDLMNVGYRIFKDTSSLLSYSFDGNVMTLDPVSTGNPGWEDFLHAYNEFCSENGGIPLFNQTKHLLPEQAKRAFGDRLRTLEEYRAKFDPDKRLLNSYFAEILG